MRRLQKDKTWAERFGEYHVKNPGVYESFKSFAFQVINAGRKCGAHDIMCRIRWETLIDGRDDYERFKINQNFAAYYGRKFMSDFPVHGTFFNTRVLRG